MAYMGETVELDNGVIIWCTFSTCYVDS